MPTKALQFCHWSGCDELVTDGYCAEHKPLKQQLDEQKAKKRNANRANSAERGYDRTWQKARLMYLHKHPLCEQCLDMGFKKPAVLVHHIVPLDDGGARLDAKNMRALCNNCHEVVHGRKRG